MISRKDAGIALPTILFAIALLSIICASSWYFAFQIVQFRGSAIHAYIAKTKTENQSIQDLISNTDTTKAFEAISSKSVVGLHEIKRELLVRNNLADLTVINQPVIDPANLSTPFQFPLLNFNLLFSNPSICNSTSDPAKNRSVLGFGLSAGAAYSTIVCMDPDAGSDNLSLLSNLAITHDFYLSDDKVISAAGYIDISSSVILNGRGTIIAGGDLHIHKLISPYSSEITLISASGVVLLDQTDTNTHIKAMAKQGVYLPHGFSSAPNALVGPILKRMVLGFKE